MRDFMTEYTGIDMTGFFDNFVLNSGTPHYSIDSFAVGMNNKDLYDVTVFVKQKRKGPAFTGNGNIMEIMFMDDNWNKFTDTIHFDGATGRSVKMVPFVPSIVLVDPEEKMCDATTDNYRTIKATGNFSFEKTFFSLEVEAVTDSAFIQVTHNWAPPDSLKEPVPGLRLSDYRYWRIDGIIPEGFQATGKFTYSATNYLDNTLITSSSDTLVILYRKDAGEDWQEIEFVKVGPWNVGNILVESLQAGEYALAVKEYSVGSFESRPSKKNVIEVYPNPSSENFLINVNSISEGELQIFNEAGVIVKIFALKKGENRIGWRPGNLTAGNYFLQLKQNELQGVETQKIVYIPY
jgi:aminopeptidase N